MRHFEGPLWSTYYCSRGANLASSRFRLFQCPLGQVGQGFEQPLEMAHTNMREGGRVSYGYDVHSVVVELAPDWRSLGPLEQLSTLGGPPRRSDILSLLAQQVTLQWDRLQTLSEIGVPSLFPGPYLAHAEVPEPLSRQRSGVYRLDYRRPYRLEPQATFAISAVWPSAAEVSPGFFLRVCLYGEYFVGLSIGGEYRL